MGAGNETTGTDDLNLVLFSMLLLPLLSSFFLCRLTVGCYLLASSDISKLGKLTYRLLTLISVNLGQKENVLSFQLLQTRISLFSTELSLRFCGHPLF